MAKVKTSVKRQIALIEKYGKEAGLKLNAKFSRKDLEEIGCEKFRLWSKTVTVISWEDKWKTVNVKVNGKNSIYNWPFHNTYEPFFNFEVLKDINYLERFANGERVNGRYGVVDGRLVVDGVYLGDKRYLLPDFGEMEIKIEKTEKFII